MKRRLEAASAAFTKASLAAPSSSAPSSKRQHAAGTSAQAPAQPSSRGPLALGPSELDELDEDERRALRASRFASAALPPPAPKAAPPPSRRAVAAQAQARDARSGSPSTEAAPRLAHPGGTMSTNKAAALMRFLERRVKNGEASAMDPRLVECAVKNAQESLKAPAEVIKHVDSFDDGAACPEEEEEEAGQGFSWNRLGPRGASGHNTGNKKQKKKGKHSDVAMQGSKKHKHKKHRHK